MSLGCKPTWECRICAHNNPRTDKACGNCHGVDVLAGLPRADYCPALRIDQAAV